MGIVAEKEKIIASGHEKAYSHSDSLEAITEHRESKKNNAEKRDDKHAQHISEALDDAKKLAEHADEGRKGESHPESPAQRRHGSPSKKQRSTAFKETMKEVRQEMGPGSRITSSIIHNRIVETTSDFVATTIARPNALLSGSIVAFISVTILYFFAKNYGYQLSGFETIGAFVIGWIIGIVYDYVSIGLRNKR